MGAWRSRFRRSVGGRFVRVTLSKGGVTGSVGIRGFRRSVHSSGRVTDTIGLPGTGFAWVRSHKLRKRSHTRRSDSGPGPAKADRASLADYVDRGLERAREIRDER